MRAILHIGTEKTGSSSLQSYLSAAAGKLRARGVHCCAAGGRGNNRALAAAFMADDDNDDFMRLHGLEDPAARAAWREDFLQRFRAEVEGCGGDTFVISSEHFHSRLLEPSQVHALADFLAPLFSAIEVRVYLRRQDELALSFYSQKLRAGFIPPTILPLANIRRPRSAPPPYFDFDALLDRWADAFGESSVHPTLYTREALHGGDVVHDFCQAAGIPVFDVKPPAPVNPALPAAAQAALLRFNECCAGDRASRDRHRATRETLVAYLQQHASGASVLPPRAEAREFYGAFAAGNARVARRWFGRERLFDESFERYPEVPAPVDWEQAATLLAGYAAARDASPC